MAINSSFPHQFFLLLFPSSPSGSHLGEPTGKPGWPSKWAQA
jgi:hypothetical protein